MMPLHLIARRVADRVTRTPGALGDDYRAERALLAETEAAGIRDPQAVAQVGALAAELVRVALAPAGVPRWHREAAHV